MKQRYHVGKIHEPDDDMRHYQWIIFDRLPEGEPVMPWKERIVTTFPSRSAARNECQRLNRNHFVNKR